MIYLTKHPSSEDAKAVRESVKKPAKKKRKK
jgi:hypothetical protein